MSERSESNGATGIRRLGDLAGWRFAQQVHCFPGLTLSQSNACCGFKEANNHQLLRSTIINSKTPRSDRTAAEPPEPGVDRHPAEQLRIDDLGRPIPPNLLAVVPKLT
jgi:hypothetical protein